MPYTPPEPRWDILEEHLDEAEFLWGMREHALRAPNYDLDEVARGPEERLLAQIDALVVGGPAVAPRLLAPALAGREAHRVAAAAAVLLASSDESGVDAVFAAWREPPDRAAVARAIECAERPGLLARLRGELDALETSAAAEVLVALGEPLGDALPLLLASDDPAERALALRSLPAEARPGDHLAAVRAGLADYQPAVLDAAIAAGVRLGLAEAWTRAHARAGDRDGDEAMLLLALAGSPAARSSLLVQLARPRRRAAALWALGFVGTPEAVDLCCEWLDDPQVGHLAGEVVSAATGVDLVRARLAVRAPAGELRDVTPEDALPRPEPMAVLNWWTRARDRLASGRRHLAGAPRSPAALHAALAGGPMRRRPAHLLDLQLHGCPARLLPAAAARRQRAQLAALADRLARTPVDLDRPP
jgi:uncharacterized protein (TIGR02270 family)